MSGHHVAYLKWSVRQDWKRLGSESSDADALYPYAFGSGWRHFPCIVKPNTTLWIVSAPVYRARGRSHRLPPTLIARLLVTSVGEGSGKPPGERVRPDDYPYVATADRALSRYLPVNNALYALSEVTFTGSRGRWQIPRRPSKTFRPENPYSHIPMYLQNVLQLAPGSEQILRTFARQIERRRTLFLSYARDERRSARQYAEALAEALRDQGFAPWHDMTFVPQLQPTETYRVALLDQILNDGLRQARIMVALTGPVYRGRLWTRREWSLARACADEGSLRIVQVPVGGEVMDDRLPQVEAGDSAATAQRIRRWFDSGS